MATTQIRAEQDDTDKLDSVRFALAPLLKRNVDRSEIVGLAFRYSIREAYKGNPHAAAERLAKLMQSEDDPDISAPTMTRLPREDVLQATGTTG